MTVIQLGLADTTATLDPQFVQQVAAALNLQVTRDLPQFWPISATVIHLSDPNKIPSGVWPVQIVSHLPPPEGGFHLSKHNQPYAKVLLTPGSDAWTVAASHETIEMLIDPSGNRLQASRSIQISGGKIQDGASEFEYLVEACDPCEDDTNAYSIAGVVVSDFLTPHYYDAQVTPGTRYSFNGSITGPRQVLPGGYISWIDPISEEWQQLQYPHGGSPRVASLGPAAREAKSLREWLHGRMSLDATSKQFKAVPERVSNESLFDVSRRRRQSMDAISIARRKAYD